MARPPHLTPNSARVAREPCARAKNSIDAFWRVLCGGDHPVVQNPTKTAIRGHSRSRLADREGVLVAHPRPATPKIPPCTPNEFFAKQLPTTPPPDGVLRHIARQLPLIWAPAASHTPSRSPYKAHRSAAIWRKPAHGAGSRCAELVGAAQLARLRLSGGASTWCRSGSGPRHNQGGGLVSPAAQDFAASGAWDAAPMRG